MAARPPRWWRKYKGFTVEFLAAQLGMNKSTYSRKERNLLPFSLSEALRLAKLYRVPVEAISWFTAGTDS